MDKIRIFLIEDNVLFCEGIMAITKQNSDIEIIASSDNGNEIPQAKKLNPDIILMDLSLSHQNSYDLISRFQSELPDTKVIVLDLIPAQSDIIDLVKAGVSGFILKNATMEEFLNTIRTVESGEKVLPPIFLWIRTVLMPIIWPGVLQKSAAIPNLWFSR